MISSILGVYFIVVCVACLLASIYFLVRLVHALSSKVRDDDSLKHYFVWLVISCSCLTLLLVTFFPSNIPEIMAAKEAKTHSQMNQFQTAILAFETEYDVSPETNDNAHLVKILTGISPEQSNPRGIAFLNQQTKDLNSKGEALDAWGTPLRIILIEDKPPLIQSAGPGQKWGTPDDMDNGRN